ncbi:hypothetical protein [Runella slithyformis]|uniref:hypothetical protein n=1 Tax=Runella slithyformis TaxID=106 RepID=UPI00146C251F|nr:hypothetical protein [Runella slithyformis]
MTKLLNLIRSVGQKLNAPMNAKALTWWMFLLIFGVGFCMGFALNGPNVSSSASLKTPADSTQFYKTLYLTEKSNSQLRSQIWTLQRRQERLLNDYEKAIIRIDSLRGATLQREVDRVFRHAK